MQNNTDGGPAFPNNFGVPGSKSIGMSLRDYFAAKAMPEAIRHQLVSFLASRIRPDSFDFGAVAEASYEMADAMLRARVQPEPKSPRETQDAHLATWGDGK